MFTESITTSAFAEVSMPAPMDSPEVKGGGELLLLVAIIAFIWCFCTGDHV